MHEQHYQARRDEHLGMERAMHEGHGSLKDHLKAEHARHKDHMEHASKMHHMGSKKSK